MLTKRTHILLEENLWKKLTQLAKAEKSSVAEIIRESIKQKLEQDGGLEKRRRAIESTLKHRVISKEKLDYKEMINYGRKY